MGFNNYTYSPTDCVIKKSYGSGIFITVTIEFPKRKIKNDNVKTALTTLKEDIINLLSDEDFEILNGK